MKKYIIQHCTEAQGDVLNLVRSVNEEYATKFGFEYVADISTLQTDRDPCWDKISFINQFLTTADEGALVVWEDADSLNLGNESFDASLPPGFTMGMVSMRGGLGCKKILKWFNSGIIVFVNNAINRQFFHDVWEFGGQYDETGIMGILRDKPYFNIASIDVKWNVWNNNAHLADRVIIQTFHGVPGKKFDVIKKHMAGCGFIVVPTPGAPVLSLIEEVEE